jgi:Rifampin ADP-ribosyl transferase
LANVNTARTNASVHAELQGHPMSSASTMFSQSFFHGTRADLKPGDLILVGHQSNFTDVKPLSWVYFAATLDAAIWGAELAVGSGRERIYVVEPCGPIMDDPNLTDKKFPGNPTLSYRSRDPLRVIAEVTMWQGHSPERLRQMKDNVARAMAEGNNIID